MGDLEIPLRLGVKFRSAAVDDHVNARAEASSRVPPQKAPKTRFFKMQVVGQHFNEA